MEVLGLIELLDPTRVGGRANGYEVLGTDGGSGNRVAAIAAGGSRRESWSTLHAHGWMGASVVHPGAIVSSSACLGDGCLVGPGAVIGAQAVLGDHVLVSRGALVGHHTSIADFTCVLPGANIAGNAHLGSDVTVGMGAAVVDHVCVGDRAVVAAGAVVLRDVDPDARVQGLPARPYSA